MSGRSNLRTVSVSLAILALNLMAAFSGAQNGIVSTEHADIVRIAEGDQDAPFGPWTTVEEAVTFYFHNDRSDPLVTPGTGTTLPSASPPPIGTTPDNGPTPAFYMDYERPVTNLGPEPTDPINVPPGGPVGGEVVPSQPLPTFVPNQSDPRDHKIVITTTNPSVSQTRNFAYFTLPLDLATTEGLRINSIFADVFADCTPADARTSSPGVVESIAFSLDVVDRDGNRVPDPNGRLPLSVLLFDTTRTSPTGSPAQGVLRFTGTLPVGTLSGGDGFPVPPQSRLQARLAPGFSGSCTVHFDTVHFPSRMIVTGESARVATWVEDLQGKPILGVPDPQRTSNRRFKVEAVHVSAWPRLNHFVNDRVLGPLDGTDNLGTPGDHMEDFWDTADPTPSTYRSAQPDYNNLAPLATSPTPDAVILGVRLSGDLQPFNTQLVQASTLRLRIRDLAADAAGAIVSDGGEAGFQLEGARSSTSLGNAIEADGSITGKSVKRHTFTFSYPGGMPLGRYAPEVFATDASGIARGPEFHVGLKGFQFNVEGVSNCPQPVNKPRLGPDTHCVNAGEETVFRFRLNNTGASSDQVSVSVAPPGGNWKASVEGGLQSLHANGGQAEVLVRVTPPATELAGTNRTLLVTAASGLFPSEVRPVTRSINVSIVAAVRNAVDLQAGTSLVEMRPGDNVVVGGLRVTNLGTRGATFTLASTVPTYATDWTAQVSPTGAFIEAGSSRDFQLAIKASRSAADADVVPITLLAQRVGDGATQDSFVLRAAITAPAGLALSTVASLEDADGVASRELRERGADYCNSDIGICLNSADPDTVFDNSVLFRVAVTNPGALEDTYRIVGSFNGGVPGKGFDADEENPDDDFCDPGGGSNPDGGSSVRGEYWRSALDASGDGGGVTGDPQGAADQVSGLSIQVKPGQTRHLFVELGIDYDDVDGEAGDCDGVVAPSSSQAYRLQLTSSNDASVVRNVLFGAFLREAGDPSGSDTYPGARFGIGLEPDPSDPDPVDRILADGSSTATHRFRVRSLSNELAQVRVQVDPGSPGFTRWLEPVGRIPGNLPACGPEADAGEQPRRFVCSGIGVLDELVFDLKVRAANGLSLETLPDLADVQAVTEGATSSSLRFTTEITGTHVYSARALDLSKQVEVGKAATLPFVIRNLGTSGDNFQVSLVAGNASWNPRLSLPTDSFVAAGRDLAAYVAVTVPPGAVPGDRTSGNISVFRVQVVNGTAADIGRVARFLEFTVTPVTLSALRIEGDPSPTIVVPQPGVEQAVRVRVTDTVGSAGPANVRADATTLPDGWTVREAGEQVVSLQGTPPVGTFEFHVTAPDAATATSRAVLTVTATRGTLATSTDLVLNRADSFGVRATVRQPNATIIPGGVVTYGLRVVNDGLGSDTFNFTHSPLPSGWTLEFTPAQLNLDALELGDVEAKVSAPLDAAAGTDVQTTAFVVSRGDPSKLAQVPLRATVGFNRLNLTAATTSAKLGPEETATFALQLHNEGNLDDQVRFTSNLTALSHGPFVAVGLPQAPLLVKAGETVQVPVTLRLTPQALPGVTVEARINASSVVDAAVKRTFDALLLRVQALEFVSADADLDGLKEYAVDRDGEASNGFEQFAETQQPGGKASRAPDLTRFLSEEARRGFERIVPAANGTTTTVFDYAIDGDKDGKRDHFVDSNGDDFPDAYWDPDAPVVSPITAIKDVDGDAQPEILVDLNGAPSFDAAFDLKAGRFIPLLQKDVDLDGVFDLVVDANGNGRVDPDETVLFSRTGKLVKVLQVDVDGDGRKDAVYDADGDDTPDFFIPAGQEEPIDIVLKDVTGDGKADWTFDADGDKRRESYYDPVTGQSGLVDAQQPFLAGLAKYWYVGALFLVVVALFAVLLVVTRR